VSVCRFCGVGIEDPRAAYDRPVVESANFLVVSSLGGFVEGWLLVLPRRHFLNLRVMPPELRAECNRVVSEAAAMVERVYGPTVAFEHGPSCPGSPAGCSIDHAHMHVVPHRHEVRSDLERELGGRLQLHPVKSVFAAVSPPAEASYIFLQETTGERYLGFSEEIPSQLVRRILARRVGRGEQFDWRDDLALETVMRTRAAVVRAA